MPKLNRFPEELRCRDQFELFDDFYVFTDATIWTDTSGDSGASTAHDADGVGGIVTTVTGGTDNNEAYLHTTAELFQFLADRPIVAEARLQFTEANTDDANVMFGLMDAIGADSLVDDGAGPKASYSGAVIFKVDGGTVWQCETSNGATQTTTTSTATAGGSSYQTLRIEVHDDDGSNCEVTFFLDGLPLLDSHSKPIKHRVAYASATQMDLGYGVKAGAGNSETVNCDYLYAVQRRA